MNDIICAQAVVRPNGGNAVVLNWSMFTVYGVNKCEVLSLNADQVFEYLQNFSCFVIMTF